MDDVRQDTLLVILGAGASYDCLPGGADESRPVVVEGLPPLPLREVRPPLTQQLASARPLTNSILKQWPSAAPVVDYLRRNLDERNQDDPALTLEQALKEYEAWGDDVPEVKRHMLAVRFYIRDLIWATTTYMMSPDLTGGITNQLTLVREAMRWCWEADNRDVVFISFNYDLLLELAVARWAKFNLVSLTSYLDQSRLSILKPHGSVQWHWTLPEVKHYEASLREHGEWGIEEILRGRNPEGGMLACLSYAPHDSDAHQLEQRDLHLPAIALPVDGKTDFLWPEGQKARLASLEGGGVSRLLTIGWRAMEPHFLELLRPVLRREAKTLVVTGGGDGEQEAADTKLRLQQATHASDHAGYVIPDNWERFGDGFTGLMRNSKELRWLLDD